MINKIKIFIHHPSWQSNISIFHLLNSLFKKVLSIPVICLILFLFHLQDGVCTRLLDLLLWFWRLLADSLFLLMFWLDFSLEYISYWLLLTGIVVLDLDGISEIIQVVIPCSLVHHRHIRVKTVIATQTECSKIIFIEITFFLHLFNCGKHSSFLLFSLPPNSETGF